MFKVLRALSLAIGATAIAGMAQAQTATGPAPLKLGYVNTATLMSAAPGRAAAESLYNKESADFAAQQKQWTDSLQKLIDDYTKAEPKLTDAQKTAQTAKITGIRTDLEALNLQGQQKMQQRENDLLAPLMEIVKNAIDEIRTEGGYAFIFSADENSPIVSADKNLDLTDRVLARMKTMTVKAKPASAMAPAAMHKPPAQ
jgi:outer membrane protein